MAELIFVSTSVTQPTLRGHEYWATVYRAACLFTPHLPLVLIAPRLPTEGWPGWVDLDVWLNIKMIKMVQTRIEPANVNRHINKPALSLVSLQWSIIDTNRYQPLSQITNI